MTFNINTLNWISLNIVVCLCTVQSCYLTPDHYSDAVNERALSGLCGLAVCRVRGVVDPRKAFDDKGQMFTIDSRNNRVFDIRERRVCLLDYLTKFILWHLDVCLII